MIWELHVPAWICRPTTWLVSHRMESGADFLKTLFLPCHLWSHQSENLTSPTYLAPRVGHVTKLWPMKGKQKSAIMFLKSFTHRKDGLKACLPPSISCLERRHLSKTCPSFEGIVRNVNGLKMSVLLFVTLSPCLQIYPNQTTFKPVSQYQKVPTSNLIAAWEKEAPGSLS